MKCYFLLIKFLIYFAYLFDIGKCGIGCRLARFFRMVKYDKSFFLMCFKIQNSLTQDTEKIGFAVCETLYVLKFKKDRFTKIR